MSATDTFKLEVLAWLIAERQQRGLSQRDIAAAIGMKNQQHYGAVERGALRLAPEYHLPLAVLFGLDATMLSRRLLAAHHPAIFALLFAESAAPLPAFTAASREAMGERLRALREARGISQGELAKRLGLPRYHMVSLYERGVHGVAIGRFVEYADALDVDQRELVGEMLKHYEPELYQAVVGIPEGF